MQQLNHSQARFNMVEQQVRTWNVLDSRVLEILKSVPREDFVPEAYQGLAYADTCVPLAEGQSMMKPVMEGRLMQALNVSFHHTVLEIGTGTGYVTALLAKSGRHVTTVEINAESSVAAASRLNALDINNVSFATGDASQGWQTDKTFDAIAITGALPILPEAYLQLLKPGGRLFVVTGASDPMQAMLITRINADEWNKEALFETEMAPLVNAELPPIFSF